MPPVLYLIDGHALAYRTYFALATAGERLQTRSGEPTAGIYGFCSVLLKILEQDRPDYLAVAFDTGKTFRNDLYPDYKATRAKMPDDLRAQIERLRQIVDAFNLPRLEKEGVEADDVLGSIARQAVEKGLGVKIITGDRDLLQLVRERVIVNLAGNKLSEARDFTAADVVETLGVRPEQVIEYKGLVGDKSDNIPGVPGVGEKTAVGLLQQYATLEEIYAHIDELKGAVRTRLEDGRDLAFLSRDLATIRTDVGVSLDLEKARANDLDLPAVEAIFRELEFKSLIARLPKLAPGYQPPQAAAAGGQLSLFGEPITQISQSETFDNHFTVVDTPEALRELQQVLSKAEGLAVDTETTGIDPLRAELVGISLSVAEGQGYYIPVGHRTGEPQLPLETVRAALLPAFTDSKLPKYGHNAKYDLLALRQAGLDLAPITFDTMIAGFLIDPASRALGLKDMAEDYLSLTMTHIEELIGKGKNQISMDAVPVGRAAAYAAADAEVTLRLVAPLRAKMAERGVEKLFGTVEMPLVPVLAMMEQNGIALDLDFLKQMSVELTARLGEIETKIYSLVGYNFNLNSTQQLSDVLFKTLRLLPPDPRKKTASGHFSTSADVLEELRGQHDVVDLILEFRELAKLKSTYLDALPLEVNSATGRVHTSFNQVGSVTGRLASSDPNLQNIPTRTELGRKVRQAFVAAPGHLLLSVDYSQIELRIVAAMSGDEAMRAAFLAGQDIHAATAAAILNIPLEQVTKDQRRNAKAINFGLIYGMSSFGLSRSTGLTLAEAENFVKAYFAQFPGVRAYLDDIRRQAGQRGYVETLLGRRRYFPNLQSGSNYNLRAREEREAINAPIQGTAADIMKLAMIALPPALDQAGLHARLLLQVHDELVLEIPENELQGTARVVQDIMENAYPLSIPLETEARSGISWGVLQPLK
ncbi:MAG: DNA polymerase I [Chloroflexi bacterium]|nr:DNA polymerase I [Chloroflexota bacterium]